MHLEQPHNKDIKKLKHFPQFQLLKGKSNTQSNTFILTKHRDWHEVIYHISKNKICTFLAFMKIIDKNNIAENVVRVNQIDHAFRQALFLVDTVGGKERSWMPASF